MCIQGLADVICFCLLCASPVAYCIHQEPLTARRDALYSALREAEGQLQYATAKTSRDVEELQVGGGQGGAGCVCWWVCHIPYMGVGTWHVKAVALFYH